MDAEYTIEVENGYVLVRLEGAGSIGLAQAMWKEVRDTCIETGLKRILGVGNHSSPPSVTEGYMHIDLWDSLGFGNQDRIAWVELSKNSFSNLKFIETAMMNRGKLVRIFDNINDAKEWLLK